MSTAAVQTLGDVTAKIRLNGVKSDPAVIQATARRTALEQELTLIRRRRAERMAERDALYAGTLVTAGHPNAIVERGVEILRDIAELDAKERMLMPAKIAADADVAAAVDAAREVEQAGLAAQAREITRRMLPVVQTLVGLNAELEAVRRRAGYHSQWPLPIGAGSPQSCDRWLQVARAFVRTSHP